MEKVKYLILGAGPAGLTLANRLLDKGIDSFKVLEKENEAGGLCRSHEVDGSQLDIGGGHFLDVRRPKVDEFLFRFMPEEEWNVFSRVSKIKVYDNVEIDYPFEANIWQFPVEEQEKHLVSIAKAGCNNGVAMPLKFMEWIPWKLGEKVANDYMLPYNKKMWSMDLNKLGTYWLEKLPNVSFEETVKSCLEHKASGTLPGHAKFYYPKEHGYGELWKRMADRIKNHIEYNVNINSLDMDNLCVNGRYEAETIISTIPWTCLEQLKGVTEEFSGNLKELVHTSVVVKYYNEEANTEAHWTYYPDETKEYHRILWRSNFCTKARGYWTETNLERANLECSNWHYVNEYAYPVNTIEKPSAIQYILKYAKDRNVIGLGRWGEWEHYNSDLTVERAMELAEKLN